MTLFVRALVCCQGVQHESPDLFFKLMNNSLVLNTFWIPATAGDENGMVGI